jgi:hypothetical protein
VNGIVVLAAAGLAVIVAAAWWFTRRPSNERDWQPDVARVPTAEVRGDIVTIRNLRNFRYRTRTDFDERWEERSYDLRLVDGMDLFFIHWGSRAIAHTIVSWAFEDGRHLAISIETRKHSGQKYSAWRGFFRQYELVYVVADESDVIKLRTNYRREEVYLYRLRVSPLAARNLLVDYLGAMNEISRKPLWYNALLANCTTILRQRVIRAGGQVPFSWRIFANGYLPELLYRQGRLDTMLPFSELKAKSFITEKALALPEGGDYSEGIRAGLPVPAAP